MIALIMNMDHAVDRAYLEAKVNYRLTQSHY